MGVMHTRGTPRRCMECARVARRLLRLGICCPAVPAKPMAFFSHMGRADPAPGGKTVLELAVPGEGAGGAAALVDVCLALTLTRAGAAGPRWRGGQQWSGVLGVPAPTAHPVAPRPASSPAAICQHCSGAAWLPPQLPPRLPLPWPRGWSRPVTAALAGRGQASAAAVPPRGKDKSSHVAQAQGRPQTKAPPVHPWPQPSHPPCCATPASPAWPSWGDQSAGRAGCGARTSGRDGSRRFGTQPEHEQGHGGGAPCVPCCPQAAPGLPVEGALKG